MSDLRANSQFFAAFCRFLAQNGRFYPKVAEKVGKNRLFLYFGPEKE